MLWPTAWAAPSTDWPDSRAPVSSSAWRPDSRRASTPSWPGLRRRKEIIMEDDGNDAEGYLGCFFLGGIIGAPSALLLSPKTGREIRGHRAERGGERARSAQG